jgi:hypothetical protein
MDDIFPLRDHSCWRGPLDVSSFKHLVMPLGNDEHSREKLFVGFELFILVNYEAYYLVGSNAVLSSSSPLTFRENILLL